MTIEHKVGWGFPLNSKKAHWFVANQSLCGGLEECERLREKLALAEHDRGALAELYMGLEKRYTELERRIEAREQENR